MTRTDHTGPIHFSYAPHPDGHADPGDAEHRPSEVRLDRILTLDPAAVRREGATVDRPLFDRVTHAVQDLHN